MKTCCISPKASFEIGNMNYLTVERPSGFKMSFSDGRKQHSFIYTVCGSLRYTFLDSSSENIVASAGDLVLIPAGSVYTTTYLDQKNVVEMVQFDLSMGVLPDYLCKPFVSRSKSIDELFSSVNHDLKFGMSKNPIYFQYKIYKLFWHLSQNTPDCPAKFKKIQNALQEIHLHYYENQKISYYAYLCDMSESGFRRLFGEYVNMSPIQYRNNIRMQEAKKLLQSGEFSIEEVAMQVGFSNISFFYRFYKQIYGKCPGKDM